MTASAQNYCVNIRKNPDSAGPIGQRDEFQGPVRAHFRSEGPGEDSRHMVQRLQIGGTKVPAGALRETTQSRKADPTAQPTR
jgi:hypothetical protein